MAGRMMLSTRRVDSFMLFSVVSLDVLPVELSRSDSETLSTSPFSIACPANAFRIPNRSTAKAQMSADVLVVN
eukprot:13398027-Heterocapsa_arctica.AAC.1